MSGGVDSSVSAALLKGQDFDVTGIFIKVWQPGFIKCTWRKDRADAMRVCAKLEIPFQTFDLEKEYKKHVVDYMIDEYKKGRTPNPDVMCNKFVKFGAYFDRAMKSGADLIATGHYSRVEGSKLLTGVDKNKDQSYFLWTLNKDVLSKTLFPVGSLTKPEVRKLAEKFGLHTATKKDSQGVCFIGEFEMREFLKHFIDAQEGSVLDEENRVIGKHEGAMLYTLGQRRGFTVTKKGPDDKPRYVVKKDIDKNTVTVSQGFKESQSYGVKEIVLEKTSWIPGKVPREGEYEARIRYRQPLQKCKLVGKEKVEFAEIQKGVALGQSLVLYNGEECLGGGAIS